MNSLEQFKNLISQINIEPQIAIMVICIVLTFVIEIVLIKNNIINIRKNNSEKVEKAKILNHILKAKRIDIWDDGTPGDTDNSFWHAKYVYNFNSKEYVYRYLGKNYPPMELTLYYINNPRKVFFLSRKELVIF